MTLTIVNQIRAGEFFSQEMRANGPWEAKFKFCGQYGFHPDDVTVTQDTRGAYWCSIGEYPGFMMTECMS